VSASWSVGGSCRALPPPSSSSAWARCRHIWASEYRAATQGGTMTLQSWATGLVAVAALGALAGPPAARAADEVVIVDIDDLSVNYADVAGAGAVEAIKMAIADFGGSVLGKKINVLVADHQNKPDIGASKFREWADQNGLSVLLGGSNSGVSIAMAK